jgi:hypothetical protein
LGRHGLGWAKSCYGMLQLLSLLSLVLLLLLLL